MTSSSSTANRLCKKGYRRCINGRCIGHQFWCDGTDDCGDHSDVLPCNREKEFTSCVRSLRRMDECAPTSERTNRVVSPVTLCKLGEFQCKDGSCISNYSRCDQVVNCEDASDEMNCRE